MYTQSDIAAVKVFVTASRKFEVLEEAILSALDHMRNHRDASIQEALAVGLMDWDVPMQIEAWEQMKQNEEDSLPF